MLRAEDKERYLRQIMLEEIGEEGQERLANSSALIVGVGGLGSPIATLLVSAGIGRIGIVDSDVVSLSNLPRQTLYTTEDVGRSKVECAKSRLLAMNPNVEIESYSLRFDDGNSEKILSRYDMVVDGCDNQPTRYVIDRASASLGRPYIYGAIAGFVGQVSLFRYGGGTIGYSDLYPEEDALAPAMPPAVMATTPAIIGAIEANEALKVAIGYGKTLSGKLFAFDSRDYSSNMFDIL